MRAGDSALAAWLALGAALIAEALLAVGAMGDFAASDPLAYASTAQRFATDPAGTLATLTPHPFDMRLGMTVPLALLYRALGASVLVSNLPCVAAALAIVAVVWAAAPTPRARLIGLAISIASVPLVRHAALLLPDLPCAALLAVATLALARRGGPRGAAWLAGGMLAWFAAFLVKETALWLAPVWLYALVADARAAALRRHGAALVIGVLLAGGYLALCAHVWGDPLARFRGIDALAGEHTWTLLGQPARAWIARLTWEPVVLFAKLGGLALVPAVLAGWLVRGPARIWVVATGVIAALFWWGSSSLSTYAPLPLRPRMALPVLPGLLVLATLGTDALVDRVRARVASPRVRWALAALALALLVGPALRPLHKTLTADRPETDAYARVQRELAAGAPLTLVCADPRGPWIAPLYFGFAPPAHLRIRSAAAFAAEPAPTGARVLVLANARRAQEFRASDGGLETLAAIDALALPALSAHPAVKLLDAGDGARLWAMLRACATCSSSR